MHGNAKCSPFSSFVSPLGKMLYPLDSRVFSLHRHYLFSAGTISSFCRSLKTMEKINSSDTNGTMSVDDAIEVFTNIMRSLNVGHRQTFLSYISHNWKPEEAEMQSLPQNSIGIRYFKFVQQTVIQTINEADVVHRWLPQRK